MGPTSVDKEVTTMVENEKGTKHTLIEGVSSTISYSPTWWDVTPRTEGQGVPLLHVAGQ